MRQRLGKASYSGCKLYSDFRDVLARDDIDAIWGTVPDHWHGCLYSRVIESGKDIYGEKPLSRWIAQGVKLKKLVRQYGTIFQVGLQQRSDPKFRLACNLARNGYLGKISEVQVAVPGGTVIPAVPPCDPPAGFDWDMWTGPAPMFPFDPRRVEWLGLYMISIIAPDSSPIGASIIWISPAGACRRSSKSRSKSPGAASCPTAEWPTLGSPGECRCGTKADW